MSRPSISVIVPLHDHGATVEAAIDSVLAQGYAPLELIVVDDGSADDGPARVARYGEPVKLIRQPRRGAGAARNRGSRESRGELLVFLDADDLLAPGSLERHASALRNAPELDGVHGDVVPFGGEPEPWSGPARPGRLPGSLMLRRAALTPATMFPEEIRRGEVVDWVARLEEGGVRLGHVPGAALRRRLHPGNHGHGTHNVEYVRLLKRILDRRRGVTPPR